MRAFLAFSLMFLLSLGLGALTNALNSHVSPEYFRAVLGWEDTVDVQRAAIAQGLFESSFYGVGLGVLFGGVVLWRGRRVSPKSLVRAVAGSVLGALVGWFLGGLVIGGPLASLLSLVALCRRR